MSILHQEVHASVDTQFLIGLSITVFSLVATRGANDGLEVRRTRALRHIGFCTTYDGLLVRRPPRNRVRLPVWGKPRC